MRRCASIALLAVIASLIGACSTGFHSSSPATLSYVLRAVPPGGATAATPSPNATPSATPAPAPATLRVMRPAAGPGLDTDRIAALQPQARLDYFAGSRWAAPLPDVIEALAVENLQASGAWSAVQGSRAAFSADYELEITIRRFEADASAGSGAPTVQVSFDCALVRRADRTLLSSFTVQASEQASANRMGAVVASFDHAANSALADAAARALAAVRTPTVHSPP